MKNVKVVVGSNFGDEGKGLFTDYLADQYPNSIVVRYNGGSQAGHTVVTPSSIRHVFSHFGSGTLAGVPTYLSEFFITNPMTFRKEYEGLVDKGVTPRVYVDPSALVTMPYDVLVNQIVEDFRSSKHGSCGIGINETIKRNIKIPLRYYQLGDKSTIITRMLQTRNNVISRLKELGVTNISLDNLDILNNEHIIRNYLDDVLFMVSKCSIMQSVHLNSWNDFIFEGAQGLLLDQNSKFFPHVTPSNTGMTNVVSILRGLHWEKSSQIETIYMTRCYTTKHGSGPFENELPGKPWSRVVDLTNVPNKYQGAIRYGILDLDLLKESITKDRLNVVGLSASKPIAITCLDQVEGKIKYIMNHTLMETSTDAFLYNVKGFFNLGYLYTSTGITRDTVEIV